MTPNTDLTVSTTRRGWQRVVFAATLTATVSAAATGTAAAQPTTTPAAPSSSAAPTSAPATASGASGTATGESTAQGCDVLHVFGFQGTGQSGDDAATDIDTGFLGSSITIPLSLETKNVGRTLVPYAASFGGKPGDSTDLTYEQSIGDGIESGKKFLTDYAARCPGSSVALVGYSQGSQLADELARQIGSGDGPIPAADVAAVSLFSSPNRPANSPAFPGSATGERPSPPPGVPAADLAGLEVTAAPADGGGVAPLTGTTTPTAAGSSSGAASSGGSSGSSSGASYGALNGRVAQFCTPGDLACSLPANSTLARTAVNISGQLHLEQQDPQQTLIDLAGAVGGATLRTAADVVNDDVDFKNGKFQVDAGGPTVLGRLAENSAPSDTPAADAKILRAVVKAGVMGLGAAVTVAKKVLTPATIGELATVGLANPPAALAVLGTKLVGAVASLVPPATISSVQRRMFSEVTNGIKENEGLLTMATDVRYWDTARLHGTYDTAPVTADGLTPAKFTVQWLTRLATALADPSSDATTGSTTTSTQSSPARPSSTPAVPTTANPVVPSAPTTTRPTTTTTTTSSSEG